MSFQRVIVLDHPEIIGPWVCQRIGGEWTEGNRTIGLVEFALDGYRVVAGVMYDGFTRSSISMHVASDGSRRWLSRDFLYACFAYPFIQLGCQRVTGLVPASNLAAQRFDSHLGFVLEARLERCAPDGGDMLVYRMFREDCRWIRTRALKPSKSETPSLETV